MNEMKLTTHMFSSTESLATKNLEAITYLMTDTWKNYYEYIALCIGKHSTFTIFVRYQHKLNFIQDLLIYLVVGVPVCFIQLVIGRYTQGGIFVIRRMLPLAEGISTIYTITIFALTIILVSEMETNLIYLILSMAQSTPVWNLCHNDFKDICWDYSKECTKEKPCMNKQMRLPSYLFWNHTYMGGAFPIEKVTVGVPDHRILLVSAVCWVSIYFVTILTFKKIKQTIQILVAISVIAKVFIILQYAAALGFLEIMTNMFYISVDTWLNFNSWSNSIARVVSSMMLADFTFIMFGGYATSTMNTGTLAFLGALSGHCILFLEMSIIKSAVHVLIEYSKVDRADADLFFVPHAPASLIIMPASFGLLKRSNSLLVFYFMTNVITNFIRCLINIVFLQLSLYQRFKGMQSYYKYICPAFCIVGFAIGVFLQTKEIYEIRFDFTLLMDTLIQHLNLVLLTFMAIYVYGFMRLGDDIQFMTGKQPGRFWKVTWLLSPAIMSICFPLHFFDNTHPFYTFRTVTIIIVLSPVLIFSLTFMLKKIYQRDILSIFKPDAQWGPVGEEAKTLRKNFQPRKQTKYKQYHVKCNHSCLLHNKIYKSTVDSETYYDRHVLHVLPMPTAKELAKVKKDTKQEQEHELKRKEPSTIVFTE